METKLIQEKSDLKSDSTHSVLGGLAEFIPLRDKNFTHFSIENPTSAAYWADGSGDSYIFIEFMTLLPFLQHDVYLLDAGMYDGLE
jgi:hypothetical protein